MDVLIKGMEIPSSCSECDFCGYYGSEGHRCDITHSLIEYDDGLEKRRDDCPFELDFNDQDI